MSFASAPADHWFSGRSTFTNPTTWSTNAYSYNNQSYSPSGLSGDYWIDVSAMGFNEILMMTGNGKYWISFEVGVVAIGSVGKCFAVESSGNFPVSLEASQLNYKETVSYTGGGGGGGAASLVIVAGSVADDKTWQFWEESSLVATVAKNQSVPATNAPLRQENGGVVVFGRYQAPLDIPPPLPHTCDASQPTGTYVLNINSVPTSVYCENEINGGGWMSFASSPTSNWFSGNSGSPTLWTTNAYSYNPSAYSPAGETGDYWIDVSGLGGFDELLLVTGNRKYWVSFMVQDMPLGAYDKPFLASSTSKNFPEDLSYRNTYANAFYRSGVAQEPWISVGVVHAQNSEWMFWGEGKTNVHFNLLRQNNGGVLLLGRFLTRGFGVPKVSPTATFRREGTGSPKMYTRTKNFLNPGMNVGTAWDGPVKTSLAITSTEYFDASVTSTVSTAFITTTTSTTTITFTTTTPTTATTTTSKTTTTSTATSTTTTSSATTTSRTTTSSTTTSSTTTTSKTTTSSTTGTSTTKTTTTTTTATSSNLLLMASPSPTKSFPAASTNNQ